MRIAVDDPLREDVAALIAFHAKTARGLIPQGYAHALDAAALVDPAITFFTARDGETLLGMAALRAMSAEHVELKSMRTTPAALRRGVGRALLAHVIAAARARGFARLSLETGTGPMFVPANALYEAAGFTDCAAFGGYPASPHNRFMTMGL
ncbi:GNAT family N-acetyltransferase [Sphingomonas sp.]|uniref:GNAT family N-acetyltransferase n=1 Tax=Sphingomonas sp. TaxID=28214 RepID=UPI003B00C05A